MRRYYLRASQKWLPLPRGDHGLGVAQGAELAAIEHNARSLLRRGFEQNHRQIRPARDHEHGSGQPVYRIGMDHDADRYWSAHLDGWARMLPRQHLHRTVAAVLETGGHLPRRNQ